MQQRQRHITRGISLSCCLSLFILLPCALALDASSNLIDVDQFHIQTDGGEGDRRFFRYQTKGGQFRKETVLPEEEGGGVVGTFGWVDAAGVLRVTDYVADDGGYRVLRRRRIRLDAEGREIVEKGGRGRVQKTLEKLQRRRRPRLEAEEEDERRSNSLVPPGNSHRLERRIDHGNGIVTVKVEPLFGLPPVKEEEDLLPQPFFVRRIQPRGEGFRTRYQPIDHNQIRGDERRGKKLRRRVVKRRRRPNAIPGRRVLDYQTDKAFHRESVSEDGGRVGEFGYIDPLGVRRVVTYETEGGGGNHLLRVKENDYVGDNTYFPSVRR